jgi:hypothetical protein
MQGKIENRICYKCEIWGSHSGESYGLLESNEI